MKTGPNKDTPVVKLGELLREGKQPISLGSPEWYVWVATAQRFYVEGEPISFTARHEQRQRGDNYWYGYRRVEGRLHNVYMGLSSQLTRQKLRETAEKLHNKVLTSLEQDVQRQHPDLPPPARLKVGHLATLRPGYEATWTDKRHKRRFDDGEMVVVAHGPSLGSTISYTIRKLDKPKITVDVLATQLAAVVETIQQELLEPLDLNSLEPGIKARLEKMKPYDRANLSQAAYYLLRAGGAADLDKATVDGNRPYLRDLVFPRRYEVSSLHFDGFLTSVPEGDGTFRQRLTPLGILALRWLKATQPAKYGDVGIRSLPKQVLKIAMWLPVERNNSFVRGKKKAVDWIERVILRPYDMEKESNGNYILSIPYTDEDEIDSIIEEIFDEAAGEADIHDCFLDGEGAKALDDPDRYW